MGEQAAILSQTLSTYPPSALASSSAVGTLSISMSDISQTESMAGILTQAAVSTRAEPGGIIKGCLSQRDCMSCRHCSWVARGLLSTFSTSMATSALVAGGSRSASDWNEAQATDGPRARKAAQIMSD